MFGELETLLRIANVPAQGPSQATTVSFLIDEHVPADSFFLARPVGVVSGDEGRQEREERDLDERMRLVSTRRTSSGLRWATTG